MRILSTLDEPHGGDAFVDGFSVLEDPDRVRSRLGFMPDYFGAYHDVNVREYLDFFARAYGLRGGERKRAIEFAMDFTELHPLAAKPIDGLSKGMKQRLCLGRTMIHDPSVMVLDEPAAGLDPRARIELREMIRRLADLGKAILISSHILTELAEMCRQNRHHRAGPPAGRRLGRRDQRRVTPDSVVRIRLLEEAQSLAKWLESHDQIADLHDEGAQLKFRHAGGEAEQAELLAKIIAAGFRPVEFATQTKSLEDVFLQVTKGHVQ